MMKHGLAHGTVVTAPRQVSRLKISFANKHDFTNRVYILTAFIFSRDSPPRSYYSSSKTLGVIFGSKILTRNFEGCKICRGNSQLDKFVEEIFGPAKTVDYYFVRSSFRTKILVDSAHRTNSGCTTLTTQTFLRNLRRVILLLVKSVEQKKRSIRTSTSLKGQKCEPEHGHNKLRETGRTSSWFGHFAIKFTVDEGTISCGRRKARDHK
jgi:hypothetical protein